MTTLKFADTHNMVAFLSKPTKSDGFEQISTSVVKTIDGEVQLHALVDGKKIIISEASVRRDLKLEDEEGIDCLPNSTIFEQLALMGYEKISQKLTFYKPFFSLQWKFLIHNILQCLSPKTTAWNEFSSTMASAIIYLATNQKFKISKFIFEGMIRNLDNVSGKFLMCLSRVTPLFPTMVVQHQSQIGEGVNATSEEVSTAELKVLDLEKTKTTQANEIASLKRRVKKLEKKRSSRTHRLRDYTKVGLVLANENVVEEIVDAAQVSTAATIVTITTATTTITITTEKITLAQATKAKVQDKGKGILVEEPVKPKKKDLIRLDEEIASKLQAEFDEEERLTREKDEANVALTEE
ncbi:hypothetical protein Tco_0164804 [Tanacetum coccineum]